MINKHNLLWNDELRFFSIIFTSENPNRLILFWNYLMDDIAPIPNGQFSTSSFHAITVQFHDMK